MKISSKLALGPVLSEEMLNFRVKIDPLTAHDSYSAWREADHDDLVLAVALAAWYAEQDQPIEVGWGISRLYGSKAAQARRRSLAAREAP